MLRRLGAAWAPPTGYAGSLTHRTLYAIDSNGAVSNQRTLFGTTGESQNEREGHIA